MRPLRFLLALVALSAASVSSAQRVVLLDFEGDTRGRLRMQLVRALQAAGEVELVPIRVFREEAQGAGIAPSEVMGPTGVRAVSRLMALSAAVGATLQRTSLHVRILDPEGLLVWERELPIRRGLLSTDNARRLATAIGIAARPRPAPPPPEAPPAPPEAPDPGEPEVSAEPPPLPPPPTATRRDGERPPMLRLGLEGTTIFRSYCSRPQVESCGEYERLFEQGLEPPGETQDFLWRVPYAGGSLRAEYLPFAHLEGPLQGLGLYGRYALGFSRTSVRVTTPGSTTPQTIVISLDHAYSAMALYRYHFPLGADALVGHVGLRLGVEGRTFNVDPGAPVPLLGSQRLYPAATAELALPLARLVRVLASASWFFVPRPGEEERIAYGWPSSRGGAFELGLAGDVWGPWGYQVTFEMLLFRDRYSGFGTRWEAGGVAEESYATIRWGVTATF